MGPVAPDIRFAIRLLAKSPGISLLAILALALGIGANTAIFSLVNAALLQPLPGVEAPGRLILLERLQRDRASYNFGYPDYLDYRDRNQALSGLAANVVTPLSFTGETANQIRGDLVTGNYFSVLGVKPALGRLITPDDDRTPGEHPVAVLGHGFWQRAFAGADVLGRGVTLNGYTFTIVGVVDKEFRGTRIGSAVDVWLPISMLAQGMPRTRSDGSNWFGERAWGWLNIFGRLKPGVELAKAQTELKTIASQLEQAYPATNSGRTVQATGEFGLYSDDRQELGGFLGLLHAAVVLLLLIACGNVANLLLVRAASRRKEIAVRMALGCSRARLISQLLTEGVLLSLPAGALGLLLAPWVSGIILSLQESSTVLRGVEPSLDPRVLAFTFATSVVTGVLFGLAPALQASKTDLIISLKDSAPSSGRRGTPLQSALVVSQVALSVVLLIGAGLLVRTMQTVLMADPGFERGNLLLMSVDLTIQDYSEQKGKSFYKQVMARHEALPGVVSASLAKTVPPNSWSDRIQVFHEGDEPTQELLRGGDDLGIRVELNRIARDYFRTLGIPVLRGREFSDADRENAPAVAVINEKLARRLWPDEDPIGKRLAAPFFSGPRRPPVEIVGVVKDTRHRSLLTEPPPILYLPELQAYDGRATLVIRTEDDPTGLISAVRNEVAAVDANLPVVAVKTMSQQIASTLWQQRMAAGLIGIFGILALVLAAVGLYGVVAQFVAQRSREIAIRMAIGASGGDVIRLVVRRGSVLGVMGVAVGLAAAFASTRVLSSMLWGVTPTDPLTFIIAATLLTGVPFVASIIPARRASRIDPVEALRQE
jgi:predicted permease